MHRPHAAAFAASRLARIRAVRPRGFTLVEVLIATVLTLVVMGALVKFFGDVNKTINESRSGMEMSNALRSTQNRLQRDLGNLTAVLNPPLRPEDHPGYFEIIEGPWPRVAGLYDGVAGDTTVGDIDDMLMFTTASPDEPFIGRVGGTGTVTSRVAEVAWFVRGRTLYRRQLLVLPSYSLPNSANAPGYYANYDISAHQEGGAGDPRVNAGSPRLVANSLGDLTKRENRYAHEPLRLQGFPHDARGWGQLASPSRYGVLGLPTLYESSSPGFNLPFYNSASGGWKASNQFPALELSAAEPFDAWQRPHPFVDNSNAPLQNQITGNLATASSSRVAEDVILNNVLSFDVKVWDPTAPVLLAQSNGTTAADPSNPPNGALVVMPGDTTYSQVYQDMVSKGFNPLSRGAYVDLNYAANDAISTFSGPGDVKSLLQGSNELAAVYDTWSTHYESDGIDQDNDGSIDEGTDGIDAEAGNTGATGYGVIDDMDERETSPPYPVPLRGLQVTIRVFEPDSGQIRQVKVVQEFMPE